MPGNEREITEFLVLNKGKISLRQLGTVIEFCKSNRN